MLSLGALAVVVLAAPALGLAGSGQSAASLRAANTGLESRSGMAAQSQDVLKQLERARRALTSATARLLKRQAALEAATLEARATADTLTRMRAARSAYVDGLAATRRMNEREIAT